MPEFERPRFDVNVGPNSLFRRVKFSMKGRREIDVSHPHFLKRVQERGIPAAIVSKVKKFSSFQWRLLTAEVLVETGQFVATSWGKFYEGRFYIVVIGRQDVAETIYSVNLEANEKLPERVLNCIPETAPFYRFVREENRGYGTLIL